MGTKGQEQAEGARRAGPAGGSADAGEPARRLALLLRVPPGDPRYRAACVAAIDAAVELEEVSFGLENFLAAFIRSGPLDEGEVEAFRRLGMLYRNQGFPENAREALAKVVGARPDHAAAAEVLAELAGTDGAPGPEPGLPDLPELPVLPEPAAPRTPAEANGASGGADGPIFAVGVNVAKRYRLDERIGRGGMALVFRATDLQLDKPVAIKFLTQALDGDESDQRFKRELLLSRELVHPNIVRLFDIGLHHGFPYISMELLSGVELSSRMKGALPLAEGLDYLIQACAGLQAAHESGIVHRDVKPSNLFITREGRVKVMDFGIAKVQSAPGLTATGVIAGTPAYMSPEQVRNFSGVTAATDLYALGVIAYEMFTGSLPFSHEESMTLLLMHLNDPPPPPRGLNPSLPEELERAILKLLEKTPAARFASCGELARTLEAIRTAPPA